MHFLGILLNLNYAVELISIINTSLENFAESSIGIVLWKMIADKALYCIVTMVKVW